MFWKHRKVHQPLTIFRETSVKFKRWSKFRIFLCWVAYMGFLVLKNLSLDSDKPRIQICKTSVPCTFWSFTTFQMDNKKTKHEICRRLIAHNPRIVSLQDIYYGWFFIQLSVIIWFIWVYNSGSFNFYTMNYFIVALMSWLDDALLHGFSVSAMVCGVNRLIAEKGVYFSFISIFMTWLPYLGLTETKETRRAWKKQVSSSSTQTTVFNLVLTG